MPFQRRSGLAVALVVATLSVALQGRAQLPQPLPTLTSARQIHDLLPDVAARGFPVRLHAVATYYDPYIDPRRGALFVQDQTGFVFVSLDPGTILPINTGDIVDVVGVTGQGDYAAVVRAHTARIAGHAQLPATAIEATLTELLSGALDCKWVEIEGRVRSVHLSTQNVSVDLAVNGGSLSAVSVRRADVDYGSLVDSLVRIRGNAAPVFNRRRQMVGAHLFFPTLDQVKVLQPAPRDPFAVPATPISNLFLYSPDPALLHRVHLRGAVTLDWPGRMLCVQDGKNALCLQSQQFTPAPLGALVDVVGFPAVDRFKPTLQDVAFRAAGHSSLPVQPVAITADRAMQDDLDGQLVRLDADLIGMDLAAAQPTLILRAGRTVLPALLPPHTALGDTLPWKVGSTLRVTGVCDVQVDPLSTNMGEGAIRPQSMRLLLRSVDDISVIHTPVWTPEQIAEAFSSALIMVCAALAWIIVLRHRVRRKTQELRASEERLRHLSEHDALTGLPNRILLNDRLQTSLKRAERFQTCLGLLLVDLDEFKEVNDALGHQAGDGMLCELARRLNDCVRSTDTVARIGGDEFVILLPDLRVASEAEFIAGKVVAAVASPYEIDRAHAAVTVSVGLVTYPGVSSDPDTMMRCADQAMYAAKEKGKNRFHVWAPQPLSRDGADAPQSASRLPLPKGAA
ncbi:MAG: diguanylate cyclase domain-containing protein [Terracidiphilus sp.]